MDACSGYDNAGAPTDSQRRDLGAGAVTVSVAGGAARDVPWEANDAQYTLSLGAIAPGTPVEVRVVIPGGPVITRALTALDARVTAPTPQVYGMYWRFPFTAGSDLPVAWTTSGPAGANASLLVMPGQTTPRTYARCAVPASAGSITVPWSLLSMYGGMPGSISAISQLWLSVSSEEDATMMGVDVAAASDADMSGGLMLPDW